MDSDFKVEVVDDLPVGFQQSGRIPNTIKVTHMPTGICASCGVYRSQLRNKMIAMQMVKSGLFSLTL